MLADGLALSLQRQVQLFAKLAHPADLPGRHADHEGVCGNVFIDHRASADKSVFTDGGTANNGAVGTQRGTLFNQRATVFFFAGHAGAGVVHIGKHHARATKHVVFKRDGVVHADVVLNLDVVANHYVVADIDVLT